MTAESPLETEPPEEVLRVEHLSKTFVQGGRASGRRTVKAVQDVSFSLRRGEALGLVGESGCGKTTLSRMLLRLIEPTSGSVFVDGLDIFELSSRDLKSLRQTAQIVFQDPYASLDPRRSIGATVGEPLLALDMSRSQRKRRVAEVLERLGMDPSAASRYPHQFSGGQRQRIGIARALSVEPDLLILDEPVSALDVSIQAQVLNLLRDLREEFDLSYLLISHDLSVVRHVSDRVAVMYLGRLVEVGQKQQIFTDPRHPYTRALLSGAPVPDPVVEQHRERIVLHGDVPNPSDPPSGCSLHPRCFHAREVASTRSDVERVEVDGAALPAICVMEHPELRAPEPDDSSRFACHFPLGSQPVEIGGSPAPRAT